MSSEATRLECAICLDSCLNGVRLDCNHIFCFLCVKGSVQQSSNRCPICRQPIAIDYFDNPALIENVNWKSVPKAEAMQWQYEGRNGWWLYDTRSHREIDKAFADNETKLEVLIAGFVYIIDLDKMIQYRKDHPNRIRRIRRHLIEPNTTKGVAGIKIFTDLTNDITTDDNDNRCSAKTEAPEEGEQTETNVANGSTDVSTATTAEPNATNATQPNAESDVDQLERVFESSLSLRETRETYL